MCSKTGCNCKQQTCAIRHPGCSLLPPRTTKVTKATTTNLHPRTFQSGVWLRICDVNDPHRKRVELLLLQGSGTVIYKTGDEVPSSGIYQVLHKEHRLPCEVTLVGGEPFPPCSKCGMIVTFKLLRGVTIDSFKVVLNSLPEIETSIAAADDLEESA